VAVDTHTEQGVARKAKDKYQQRPQFQYRGGADLDGRINSFAAEHGLHPNEACKVLTALAVMEMDGRFYKAIRRMSEAMGGPNAFVRSCVHVHTALQGARSVTGQPMQFDPQRVLFLLKIANDFLTERGLQLEAEDLWFTMDQVGQTEEEAQPESTKPRQRERPLEA
jgi:hypothetical protein